VPSKLYRGFGEEIVVWALLMVNEILLIARHPVLARMRDTRLGAVVLGSSFSPWDVAVISLALLGAVWIDTRWVRRQ